MKTMGVMNQDHKVLNEKQIYKVFQNIEDIKNTAKIVWKKLEESCNLWPDSTPYVGKVFQTSLIDLKNYYTSYIKGISKALRNLSKLRKVNSQFLEFLNRSSASFSNSINHEISSLLISPVARLSFYSHSLRELLLLTPSDHVDYQYLLRSFIELDSLNSEMYPLMEEGFKNQKLYLTTVAMKGSVPDILGKTTSRAFVREGPITIISERKNRRGYLHLYSDVLIISELNDKNERVFDQMINLNGADPKELSASNDMYPFSILKDNRRAVLSAYTLAECQSWVRDIQILVNVLANTKQIPKPTLKRGISFGAHLNSTVNRTLPHLQTPRRTETTLSSPSLKKMKSKSSISESFLRAISRQHSNKTVEDFLLDLPYGVNLSKLVPKECIIKFKGPSEDDESEKFTTFASARSVSTYPNDRLTNKKINNPLADQYGLSAWSNRIIAVVTDGGNGIRYRQASERAVESCLAYFEDIKSSKEDIREMALELLKSISYAHENIIHDKKDIWDAGTTSILVSSVVEVEPNPENDNKKWCFICATVGDCRAYIWPRGKDTVQEITQGVNIIGDVGDPGGRIGPYIYQGAPDLRNLGVYYHFCSDDDMIILCTDGIHDSFDPELMGKTPHEISSYLKNEEISMTIDQFQWDNLEPHIVDRLKQEYSTSMLEKILSEIEHPPNSRKVTKALVNYCIKQTRNLREFYDQVKKQSSVDYKLFPGRLDHATCLAFQINLVQI